MKSGVLKKNTEMKKDELRYLNSDEKRKASCRTAYRTEGHVAWTPSQIKIFE